MNKHILIITGSVEEQVHLSLQLSEAGYSLTCCDCADTALCTLKETSFDAVLTDAVIGSSSQGRIAAVEFIALLRSEQPKTKTPVLVRGEFISIQNMMDTLRSGAARFIPVPCTTEELLDNLASELSFQD